MNPSRDQSQPTAQPAAPGSGTAQPPVASGRRLPATTEEWEQLRRSVAMLSPGAWALRREPALAALDVVLGRREPPPASSPE